MAIPDDSDILSTVSIKIPRWSHDQFLQVGVDTDLKFGEAGRLGMNALAKIFKQYWKRGMALGPFLELLDLKAGQYAFFFEKQDKRRNPRRAAGIAHGQDARAK